MTAIISTSAGLRLAFHPSPLVIPSDPAAALAFAVQLDRLADLHLSEGRGPTADRLAHLAHEARCRSVGARA